MSKILITALGGGFKKDGKYNEATYNLNNKSSEKTEFIASALLDFYDIDKTFIIGTTGSMWENFYRYYCKKFNIIEDEELYKKLEEIKASSDETSSLDIIQKEIEKLNEIFKDKGIEGIVIKYGMDRSEIFDNFDLIIKLKEELKNGDEVYLDITHSFRSTAFWMLLVMIYLTDIIDKKITIQTITYGMLEIKKDLKPVIELNPFIDILDWLKGASELKKYGNSYSILEKIENTALKKELETFSNAMNMNYVSILLESVDRLKQMGDITTLVTSGPGKHIIPDVFKSFITDFDINESDQDKRSYMLRVTLAKWHFEQKRYAMAAINLNEAIIAFVMKTFNFPIINNNRKTDQNRYAKQWLESIGESKDVSEFLKQYGEIYIITKKIRDTVAHSLENEMDIDNDILKLKEFIEKIDGLLKNTGRLIREEAYLGISARWIENYNKKLEELSEGKDLNNNSIMLCIGKKGFSIEETLKLRKEIKIRGVEYLNELEKRQWFGISREKIVECLDYEKIIDSRLDKIEYIFVREKIKNKREIENYAKNKGIKVIEALPF